MEKVSPNERRRLVIQADLDAQKTQAERNRMGQFATPPKLALEILSFAKTLLSLKQKVRFLDPAIGTGAFYSALLQTFPKSRISETAGFEVDWHYGETAIDLWANTGLDVQIKDFTEAEPPAEERKFDLLICNPPYVRHHHIINGSKARLQESACLASGIQISGLAGLYCYFLLLSHAWMSEGGIAGWLIPSEFMDVNYGEAIKRYLLEKVTLLHIHRFDPNDVQFGDALVSSTVVWFRKEKPSPKHSVVFSYGGTLLTPETSRSVSTETLKNDPKWTKFPLSNSEKQASNSGPRLSDFFSIRRGLATGDNDYFILTADEISHRNLPVALFKPILPSPRYLPVNEIKAYGDGTPIIKNPLFLLDCRLSEREIKTKYPSLWEYLEEGISRGVAERYLCKHRSPWYAQEKRPAAPFVCTYLGRSDGKSGKPFRFILNNSDATVTNVYLALYPKDIITSAMAEDSTIAKKIWEILNNICPKSMLAEGRVYGGGLHKLEPKELANVPALDLAELLISKKSHPLPEFPPKMAFSSCLKNPT